MPDLTPAFLDELEGILRQHVGKDDAITSGELASSVGIADAEGNPKTREGVKVLIRERHVPIGSCSQGYYVMDDPAELAENLETLRGRIAGIEERMMILTRAWNQRKYGEADAEREVTA